MLARMLPAYLQTSSDMLPCNDRRPYCSHSALSAIHRKFLIYCTSNSNLQDVVDGGAGMAETSSRMLGIMGGTT